MSQEKKKKIANHVTPILRKYKVKGSLRVRNHHTIVLTVRSGQVNFFHDLLDDRMDLLGNKVSVHKEKLRENFYTSVNPYWFHEHYTGQSLAFLTEVFSALKSENWYDHSDLQMDHFDTAYFVDVNIGAWDAPYVLTA